MAEHTPSTAAELGAPMDYAQHERTYAAFLAMSKIGVIASIVTVIALAIFAFGGAWGFWLGTLMLILMMVATAIAIATKGGVRPLIAVAVLGVLLLALNAG